MCSCPFLVKLRENHDFLRTLCDSVHKYLGMLIRPLTRQDRSLSGTVYERYSKEFQCDQKVQCCSCSRFFSIDESSEVLHTEMQKKFHSCIAKILFLACRTRQDILCATIFLCIRVKKATSKARLEKSFTFHSLSQQNFRALFNFRWWWNSDN